LVGVGKEGCNWFLNVGWVAWWSSTRCLVVSRGCPLEEPSGMKGEVGGVVGSPEDTATILVIEFASCAYVTHHRGWTGLCLAWRTMERMKIPSCSAEACNAELVARVWTCLCRSLGSLPFGSEAGVLKTRDSTNRTA